MTKTTQKFSIAILVTKILSSALTHSFSGIRYPMIELSDGLHLSFAHKSSLILYMYRIYVGVHCTSRIAYKRSAMGRFCYFTVEST